MDGGNSQPLDASDPEPEAGPAQIDSGLDPDITFQWVETPPGPGACGPNTFVGSFSCTSESRLVPYVGQMTLEVADTGLGESMLSVTGTLTDMSGLGILLSAGVEGSLDCTTNRLTATTTGGRSTTIGFDATFETEILGDYDPQALEMLGEITLFITFLQPEMMEPETCRGSFQVGAPL